jgi:hypothetical protein
MKAWLTISAAVVVAAGLTAACLFPMAWGVFHSDVSVAAFGVGGAIVALVLPASSLARDAAGRVVDAYVTGTARARNDPARSPDSLTPEQWAAAGLTEIGRLRARSAAARLASAFVYVGFLLSIFSLLQVADPVIVHIGQQPVRPWHLAVAGALACLAVGAVLFLPLAWWFWTPRLLDSSVRTLEGLAQPVVPPPPPPPETEERSRMPLLTWQWSWTIRVPAGWSGSRRPAGPGPGGGRRPGRRRRGGAR